MNTVLLVFCVLGILLELCATNFFLYVATVSVLNQTNTEKCEQVTGIPQDITNLINTLGTLLINALAFVFIVIIHKWKYYKSNITFLKAMVCVGQFWTWSICVIFVAIPTAWIHDFRFGERTAILYMLGTILIFEYVLTSLLALSIHFVNVDVLRRWIQEKYGNKEMKKIWLKRFFKVVMTTFYLRNIYLFLYEVYCISIKLSRVDESKYRFLDFVLQVMNVGYRGSASKFFFVMMFKDVELGDVCDNNIDNELQYEQRNKAMLPWLTQLENSKNYTLLNQYDYSIKRV